VIIMKRPPVAIFLNSQGFVLGLKGMKNGFFSDARRQPAIRALQRFGRLGAKGIEGVRSALRKNRRILVRIRRFRNLG
jgi:hypothetical protein